jgi:hypothetical protein
MALSDYPREFPGALIRGLKFCGAFVLNTLAALLGTAVLKAPLAEVFRPHSLTGILWEEWILSIVVACCIGFGVWQTWRSTAAKWIWLLPALWFGVRILIAYGSRGVWFHFSGAGCVNGSASVECRNFLVFTVPCIRGVSYSLGAYVSSLRYRRPPESLDVF